jgi:rod shape-determining protein MreC
MNNILAFLSRYFRIFLFLFLEGVSFYLIAHYNKTQNSVVSGWGQEFSGRFYSSYNYLNYYFHLKHANDSLLAENARLRTYQPSSKYIDTFKKQSVNDTLYRQRFVYIPAYVVNNSVTFRNNYLTLEAGSLQGITKAMGVVSTAGIVGITQNVSSHFTSVLSVLHKNFTVSAEIKENGEKGSIIWDGVDFTTVIMKDVPRHIHINIGQHVVISPYSQAFPQGTPIGVISRYEIKPGDAFYTIYVKLAADLRNISQVYVISNIMKPEQQQVERQEDHGE